MKKTDHLIIGAGIAGLSAALHIHKKEIGQVTVLCKGKLKQANTYWAQGGIAAVMSPEDSFEKHIQDTMSAGANHNNPDAVRCLVENSPRAIRFLESIGVKFREEPALEAGHSLPRVWRTSDFTGQDVLNALIKAVLKTKTIQVVENMEAIELIVKDERCVGAFVRDENTGAIESFLAKNTILATGGLGQLFEKTTNTPASGGDGIALAARAGIEPKDLEFVQFHPTALAVPDGDRYFLLSEALRGHGARVVNSQKKQFLSEYDPRAELAPRDIVTRAIFVELLNGPVYLDMRHIDVKQTKKKFPNITKRLKQYGFDFKKDPVPITPAAHFSCGGVPTDLTAATSLHGLYAVGEVACTGVHGANRLASNALLEGVVFGEAVSKTLERNKEEDQLFVLDENMLLEPPKIILEDWPQVLAYCKRIGQVMWQRAGIVRTMGGLTHGLREIEEIPARDYRVQNRQMVCYKMIQACINRPQSLGCHYIASEPV